MLCRCAFRCVRQTRGYRGDCCAWPSAVDVEVRPATLRRTDCACADKLRPQNFFAIDVLNSLIRATCCNCATFSTHFRTNFFDCLFLIYYGFIVHIFQLPKRMSVDFSFVFYKVKYPWVACKIVIDNPILRGRHYLCSNSSIVFEENPKLSSGITRLTMNEVPT